MQSGPYNVLYAVRRSQALVRRFVIGAFLGTGFMQPTLTAQSASASDAMSGMIMADSSPSLPTDMPCKGKGKGKVPDCFSSMGCIFMLALPTTFTPSETMLPWSLVSYADAIDTRGGRSVEPDIGPPIRLA